LETKEQNVNGWRIKRTVAIGIAGAVAMSAATPLYAEILSNTKAMEQTALNDATPPGAFLVLGALSGNSTVTPASSSRNNGAGGHHSALDAYVISGRGSGLARNDSKGPDDYYAPKYRNGKCVEDEGNTLVAEPAWGGAARRMDGKSLERALASLCRKAAL
jgi:hypothetical protein